MRCPDCGHANPSTATACEKCNFPLTHGAPARAVPPERPEARASHGPLVMEPPPRLKRLRKKRGGGREAVTIWLFAGALAALSLVYFAIRANVERAFEPVEGARAGQQERANELRSLLAEDSTNVMAHVQLGDVLFDTGNWHEAIHHYMTAVKLDSTRVEALVDLGVCYYNLGQTDEAEKHFVLALAREPHQTVALFNMGILNERRAAPDEALQYYHRALATEPPSEVREAIVAAIQRVQQATGKAAPPLSGDG